MKQTNYIMKKWILGVAVLIGMNFGLAAQQHRNFSHRSPAEHPQLMIQRMAEELKLTDEQKKQVEQLMLENATHQEELLKKRETELEVLKEFRKGQKQKMDAILTEEQKQILEKRKAVMGPREKHTSSGDHPRGRGPRSRRAH